LVFLDVKFLEIKKSHPAGWLTSRSTFGFQGGPRKKRPEAKQVSGRDFSRAVSVQNESGYIVLAFTVPVI
jgi:hypothetical protein